MAFPKLRAELFGTPRQVRSIVTGKLLQHKHAHTRTQSAALKRANSFCAGPAAAAAAAGSACSHPSALLAHALLPLASGRARAPGGAGGGVCDDGKGVEGAMRETVFWVWVWLHMVLVGELHSGRGETEGDGRRNACRQIDVSMEVLARMKGENLVVQEAVYHALIEAAGMYIRTHAQTHYQRTHTHGSGWYVPRALRGGNRGVWRCPNRSASCDRYCRVPRTRGGLAI